MVRLECKSPVPSDIDIAQAATPVPISEIADSAGLTSEEYDLYGNTKAKVEAPCTCGCNAFRSRCAVGLIFESTYASCRLSSMLSKSMPAPPVETMVNLRRHQTILYYHSILCCSERFLCCCSGSGRHDTHTVGGGKKHDHCWVVPGSWCPPEPQGYHMCQAAITGPHLWHQRGCSWRGLQSGESACIHPH